jgi:hypothetical protein
MLSFITSLVTFMKGVQAIKDIGDAFYLAWVKHDIDQIGGEAQAKQEEYEVLNAKFKASTTDIERRVLMRTLGRLR